MTLIMSILDNVADQCVYLSDCLVSDKNDLSSKENKSPLHHASGQNIDTKGVGMASKFIFKGNRFVVGAGSVSTILTQAEHFFEISENEISEFQEYLDARYLDVGFGESLFYGGFDDKEMFCGWSNFGEIDFGRFQVRFAGTGANYLKSKFEEYDLQPPENGDAVALTANILAILFRLEFADYDFKENLFGGAYELAVLSGNGFTRIPYAVLDFVDQSTLANDGVYESDYPLLQRLILSLPTSAGCVNVVFEVDQQQVDATVFEVPRPYAVLSELDIAEEIMSSTPMFNIALVRHSDVNFSVLANAIRPKISNDNLVFDIDFVAVDEALRSI